MLVLNEFPFRKTNKQTLFLTYDIWKRLIVLFCYFLIIGFIITELFQTEMCVVAHTDQCTSHVVKWTKRLLFEARPGIDSKQIFDQYEVDIHFRSFQCTQFLGGFNFFKTG